MAGTPGGANNIGAGKLRIPRVKGAPQNRKATVLVLAGGGIDSALCMHNLRESGVLFRGLHIDYGQPARHNEWRAVQKIVKHLGGTASQIAISSKRIFNGGEVQGRNAAFIFLGLMQLHPEEKAICIGIHAGTPFFDCSRSFFESIEQSVAEQTNGCTRLVAPLLDCTKPEIIGLARAAAIPLELTYSCQLGVERGCGSCHSCKDRKALGC